MSSVRKNRAQSKNSATLAGKQKTKPVKVDLRKQLSNGGKIGTIEKVSLPEAMITSLLGFLLDVDPGLFRPEVVPSKVRTDPEKFYEVVVRNFLDRHPVFRKAEVRSSGRGLHIIINFTNPVEFKAEADRQYWAGVIKTVQKLLPTDPDCPGITALTRALGSVNSKNGATVRQLHKGEPVAAEEVVALFDETRTAPFRSVARLLFGTDKVTPCPVCAKEGSKLDALDYVGKCYGGCGKIRIGQLFDVFLKPRAKKEG